MVKRKASGQYVRIRKKAKKQTWTVTPKSTPSMVSVRKAILGMSETKRYSTNLQVGATNMFTNTIYWGNLLWWIQTGSSESQRIGDSIHITGISVRVNILRSYIYQAAMTYRVMILESDQETHDGTVSPGPMAAGLLSDYRYGGYGTTSNPVIDTNFYTVKANKSGIINGGQGPISGAATQGSDMQMLDFYCPINRKFQYKSTASGYEKAKNLYVSFACDSSVGGTIPIGSADVTYCVHFKDM
ncbi:MAG: coat protein [Ninurtavirus cruti]|uniref:Coat protein n=1 Tax=Cressdnaviricota sp. TaxID=2748378 RepID=A0A3G2YST6_9VIRU|nr:MAG: coat protein [Cressdnaviricota sp.]